MLHSLNELQEIITKLFIEYENDEFMNSKLSNYISELPIILKNTKNSYEEKKIRISELSTEQEQFMYNFLNNNCYFYVTTNEKFFYYDKLHYSVISEDDVLYHILSSITKENSCLLSWKQKTKIHIVKKIKDKSLIKYAPEPKTIQFVLNLFYPTFFSSKTEVKYFLTVVGDSILKKYNENDRLLHYLDSKSKNFLRELNSLCYFYMGGNMIQTIKHKYHDSHNYSQCRFLKINDNIKNKLLWKPAFDYAIDIFCVACHYSNRYISSDNFLLKFSNDTQMVGDVMYLKDKTPEYLVDLFIKEYVQKIPNRISPLLNSVSPIIEPVIMNDSISWKNILYLWRNFLDNKGLPTIMFHDSLRNILISYYGDQYINDQFMGLTSKYLPLVQSFIDFWEKHIIECFEGSESELEIEEIRILFQNNHIGTSSLVKSTKVGDITDKKIIDILTYFFPHIEIVSDKYIYGFSSNLWDKDLDIEIALQSTKNNMIHVDLDEKYLYYCKYYSEKEDGLIVSKSYFERFCNRLDP